MAQSAAVVCLLLFTSALQFQRVGRARSREQLNTNRSGAERE